MGCESGPDICRAKHIAAKLDDAERVDGDYEARCPQCGHEAFRVSRANVRKYRNVWTCACKGRCGCTASTLRVALLRRDIPAACLGIYDGPVQREIDPEKARRLDLTVSDILALPGLKPADMRILLAEASGQRVPTEFGPFVKWAKSIGIGKTQAQEAAARWCRPSDCRPPQTGGRVEDTSRNTDAVAVVKSPRSEARDRSETDQVAVGNRPTDITDNRRSEVVVPQNVGRSETDQRTLGDETDRAIEALRNAGMTRNEAA